MIQDITIQIKRWDKLTQHQHDFIFENLIRKGYSGFKTAIEIGGNPIIALASHRHSPIGWVASFQEGDGLTDSWYHVYKNVYQFFTHPEFRQQGIATMLFKAIQKVKRTKISPTAYRHCSPKFFAKLDLTTGRKIGEIK